MLTLKFQIKSTDYWEVYTAESYSSEIQSGDDGDIREVYIGVEGHERLTVGRAPEYFDVCYVVNELGNTIDRIYPPPLLSLIECESCECKFPEADVEQGLCPDCYAVSLDSLPA